MDRDGPTVQRPEGASTIWCRCGIPFCCRCRSPAYDFYERKRREKEKTKQKKNF